MTVAEFKDVVAEVLFGLGFAVIWGCLVYHFDGYRPVLALGAGAFVVLGWSVAMVQ